MGTSFEITVCDSDGDAAEQATAAAFAEIRRIERLLSIFVDDSDISRLNRDKQIRDCSTDLLENVRKSLYYSHLSSGAFDITVLPVLDLYAASFGSTHLPPSIALVDQTRKRIDYRSIILGNEGVSIGAEQKITLGGIAKGYAVERAVSVLRQNRIHHALVNAGGNMRALGNKSFAKCWMVALQNPRIKDDYLARIRLNDNAVSTSGDYETYFNDDRTFHHIINPRTGTSATELISVTVITDNAWDADALSTTLFVVGKDAARSLAAELGIQTLMVARDGSTTNVNWTL